MPRNPNTIGYKWCPTCQETKPNEQFFRNLRGRRAGKLSDSCKDCMMHSKDLYNARTRQQMPANAKLAYRTKGNSLRIR